MALLVGNRSVEVIERGREEREERKRKEHEDSKKKPATIKEYYERTKKMIDKRMKTLAEASWIPKDAWRTALGGKRLRGVLAVLVAEALGGKAEEALEAAAAIELAHAVSLDLDDIVDGDTERPGRGVTSWIKIGISKVVLFGYGLIGVAGRLVSKYGPKAAKEFFKTMEEMVKGEVKDLLGHGAYEAVVSMKTASMWRLAAILGALSAGREDVVREAGEYGKAVGVAFQIADDICDVLMASKKGIGIPTTASSTMFLAYLGIESDLNPDKAKELAFRKLEEWVQKAVKASEKLPAKNDTLKKFLMEYPRFAVEQMLTQCMG